jgi:hypothetical protein
MMPDEDDQMEPDDRPLPDQDEPSPASSSTSSEEAMAYSQKAEDSQETDRIEQLKHDKPL